MTHAFLRGAFAKVCALYGRLASVNNALWLGALLMFSARNVDEHALSEGGAHAPQAPAQSL